MLLPCCIQSVMEAGVDEAGRGPLAGDVFAAAVIIPPDFCLEGLNDSKQLSERQRELMRPQIEQQAVAWAVAQATVEEIDRLNILNAAILAMHRAIAQLPTEPEHLIVDGNRFKPYVSQKTGMSVPYTTIVKGDAKYMSIAAASVLAKTHRDEYMLRLHEQYPMYDWDKNMGYPTPQHKRAIKQFGLSPYHRKTFKYT